jgi:hypothetical protein
MLKGPIPVSPSSDHRTIPVPSPPPSFQYIRGSATVPQCASIWLGTPGALPVADHTRIYRKSRSLGTIKRRQGEWSMCDGSLGLSRKLLRLLLDFRFDVQDNRCKTDEE